MGTTQQRALRHVRGHHDAWLESTTRRHRVDFNDTCHDCNSCANHDRKREWIVRLVHDTANHRLTSNGSPRCVLRTRRSRGHLSRAHVRVLYDECHRNALRERGQALATAELVGSTTLNAHVQEDQEAQGAHAPLESKSRQASQHGSPLISLV